MAAAQEVMPEAVCSAPHEARLKERRIALGQARLLSCLALSSLGAFADDQGLARGTECV